jgi:hypothetical protein
MFPQDTANMSPMSSLQTHPSAETAGLRYGWNGATNANAPLGASILPVVVGGLIVSGLLPIGSIDGEDQNLH